MISSDGLHCPGKKKRMVHHQHPFIAPSALYEILGFCSGLAHRLFDQNMLTTIESLACERIMCCDRRRDHDCIDILARQQIIAVRISVDTWERLDYCLAHVGARITHRHHPAPRIDPEITD